MKQFSIFLGAILLTIYAAAQDQAFKGYEHLFTPPLHYTATQVNGGVSIDGNLTEDSWSSASWSRNFTDIEGDRRPAPGFQTRFKMLWDQAYLYIGAELEEPAIWATLTKKDAIVFHDNDFEVFVDPDGDTHNYFEIEVNAFNTIFDLFLSKPYRNGGPAVTSWDAIGLKTAVSISGSLNNTTDTDKKWCVEMAIPFSALAVAGKFSTPAYGSTWRINFSRVEWDTENINGVHTKKTDPATARPYPEHNWVWSPQGVINMHYPERWGYLHFGGSKPIFSPDTVPLPAAEPLHQWLWLLYYKQVDHRKQYAEFAAGLSTLNFPKDITVGGLKYEVALSVRPGEFTATAIPANGVGGWLINEEGKISQAGK